MEVTVASTITKAFITYLMAPSMTLKTTSLTQMAMMRQAATTTITMCITKPPHER
jgi:hypothetical protein